MGSIGRWDASAKQVASNERAIKRWHVRAILWLAGMCLVGSLISYLACTLPPANAGHIRGMDMNMNRITLSEFGLAQNSPYSSVPLK